MDFVGLIFSIFANQDPLFKIALIVLLALYGLFALIVAIQISNLNKVVTQIGFAPIFNLLAAVHFFATLALLVFAVVSL